MVASALFIMDLKGKIIISRNYRGDIPMTVADKFARRLCVLITPSPFTLSALCSAAVLLRAGSLVPAVSFIIIAFLTSHSCTCLACFSPPLSAEEDATALVPVMIDDGVTFAFIKHNNLYRTFRFIACRARNR
jgi:hypothetical protein